MNKVAFIMSKAKPSSFLDDLLYLCLLSYMPLGCHWWVVIVTDRAKSSRWRGVNRLHHDVLPSRQFAVAGTPSSH